VSLLSKKATQQYNRYFLFGWMQVKRKITVPLPDTVSAPITWWAPYLTYYINSYWDSYIPDTIVMDGRAISY
jgi:hypothetical protein